MLTPSTLLWRAIHATHRLEKARLKDLRLPPPKKIDSASASVSMSVPQGTAPAMPELVSCEPDGDGEDE